MTEDQLLLVLDRIRRALGETSDYRFAPLPSPVDEEIGALCTHLAKASGDQRKQLLALIDEPTGYALLAYAERMSMLGVRRQSESLIVSGLVALGYASAVIDPRMALMILSLLHHSAVKLGKDPGELFHSAFDNLPDQNASEMMLGFLARRPEHQDIHAMGFAEIDGPSGLIYWQGGPRQIPEGLR
jgi:hypothetical protein